MKNHRVGAGRGNVLWTTALWVAVEAVGARAGGSQKMCDQLALVPPPSSRSHTRGSVRGTGCAVGGGPSLHPWVATPVGEPTLSGLTLGPLSPDSLQSRRVAEATQEDETTLRPTAKGRRRAEGRKVKEADKEQRRIRGRTRTSTEANG